MLNKQTKILRLSALSLAVAGAMSVAPTAANAEVAASVSVANMYLWRGQDLGNGSAAVSGDISYSTAGFYTGIWGSSGDSANGTEYDLFAGYGMDFDGFTIDASVWNYIYPSADEATAGDTDNFGGLSEFILSLGFGPVSFTIYDNIAGGPGYMYYTLGFSMDAIGVTLGYASHDHDENDPGFDLTSENDYMHVDVSYAYNDNLSFTLSQVVDQDEFEGDIANVDEDLKFVVGYSLPIDM